MTNHSRAKSPHYDNLTWQHYEPLPNTHLVSIDFNDKQFDNIDYFAKYNIEIPLELQGSAHKRQLEFVVGRLCAYQALLQLDAVTNIPMINDDGSPKWAAGYIGSITHTHNIYANTNTANNTTVKAAAIVARQDSYLGLGIDMEPLITKKSLASLSQKVLTPNELSRFGSDMSNNMSFVVTLIFSLKESLFKALYPIVGKRFYFQDAEVMSIDKSHFDKSGSTKKGTARLRLLSCLNDDWQEGNECEAIFDCRDGHVLTVVFIT